jgi:hypothetical protein
MMRALGIALPLSVLAVATPASAQDIAVIGAPLNEFISLGLDDNLLLRDTLSCTEEFAKIDTFDARAGTPTLDWLVNYHAVIVYAEVPMANPVGMGDVLADYLRQGGGVVVVGGGLMNGTAIEGEFADAFLPVTIGIKATGTAFMPTHQDVGHQWLKGPIKGDIAVYGVNNVTGGPTTTRALGLPVRPGSVVAASWDDGTPLIVTHEFADPA